MEIAKLILDVFKTIISSWPLCIFIVLLISISKFKSQIADFINRVGSLKFPGGEILSQAKQSIADRELPEGKTEDDSSLADILQGMGAEEEKERLRQIIQDKDGESLYWEYNYLDIFLVSESKRVLVWMSQNPSRVSSTVFHDLWDPLIPKHAERRTILSVLLRYDLISQEEQSGMLEVTPKGHNYIEWASLDKLFPHSGSSA